MSNPARFSRSLGWLSGQLYGNFSLMLILATVLSFAVGSAAAPSVALAATPLTTGDAISGFKDSFRLSTNANQQVEVGRINVPAGNYAINAKMYLNPPLGGLNEHVSCTLRAGVNFDRTVVNHGAVTAFTAVPLQVVNTFATSGVVILTCGHVFASGDTYLSFIKITAHQVNSLTNIRMP